MSHVATVETRVIDLQALATACNELGLELVQGQRTFRQYYQRDNHCDHAIRVPGVGGSYEIGLRRVPDGAGGYTLHWDYYQGGRGLMERVAHESDTQRQGVGKLLQTYAKTVATNRLKAKGYRVVEKRVEGKLQLVAVQ